MDLNGTGGPTGPDPSDREGRPRRALDAALVGSWEWDVAADDHARDATFNWHLGLEAAGPARTLADMLARVHPEDRPRVAAAHESAAQGGPPLDVEFRVARPGGTPRWLLARGGLAIGRDGRARLAGVVVDITRQKRDEAAREALVRRSREVAAHLPGAAVFVVDPDLRYLLAEGQALRDAGFEPADFEGRTLAEALPAGELAEHERSYRRTLAGESFRVEHPISGRQYETQGVPLRDEEGRVTAALAVSYDITERKRAEEALRRLQEDLQGQVEEAIVRLERADETLDGLLLRLITAREDERGRLSRELHDVLGQDLAALSLDLGALMRDMPAGYPARSRLREVRATVDRLGRLSHDLAVELRPVTLDDVGLAPALAALVARWSEQYQVAAHFRPVGLAAERPTPEVESAIYRVVQEALKNVAKHAGAAHVSVTVERAEAELRVVVADDGRGFDPGPVTGAGGRLGLLGMDERLALVGGTLRIESVAGRGTTIRAAVPLASPGGAGDFQGALREAIVRTSTATDARDGARESARMIAEVFRLLSDEAALLAAGRVGREVAKARLLAAIDEAPVGTAVRLTMLVGMVDRAIRGVYGPPHA